MEYLAGLDQNWAAMLLMQRLAVRLKSVQVDQAQLNAFCAHHGAPQDEIHITILISHTAMIEEQDRQSRITPRTLSSLVELEQAAKAYDDALGCLDEGGFGLFAEVAIARGIRDETCPVIVDPQDGDQPKLYMGDHKAEPIGKIRDQARAIAEAVSFALKAAEKGKPGPKKDDSIEIPLSAAYWFWTKKLGREFKLDWTRDHQPLTPAAEWCLGFMQLIDPNAPKAMIVSAARTVRENSDYPYTWEDLFASACNITSE